MSLYLLWYFGWANEWRRIQHQFKINFILSGTTFTLLITNQITQCSHCPHVHCTIYTHIHTHIQRHSLHFHFNLYCCIKNDDTHTESILYLYHVSYCPSQFLYHIKLLHWKYELTLISCTYMYRGGREGGRKRHNTIQYNGIVPAGSWNGTGTLDWADIPL